VDKSPAVPFQARAHSLPFSPAQASAMEAVHENFNQYSPSRGHPKLIQALATVYSPKFGRDLDTQEIMVSQGANQGKERKGTLAIQAATWVGSPYLSLPLSLVL
jgi:aspartate/methionine/tyrosine aminotransferase